MVKKVTDTVKMKKVLIISYHSLPLDTIASYRANAYLDHFHKYNIFPTLVTHIWERSQRIEQEWKIHRCSDDVVYEKSDNYEVYKVPKRLYKIYCWKKKLPSKLRTVIKWLQGDLDYNLEDSYFGLKQFLFSHLQIYNYDLVLAIFSPHNHLKLAFEINQKFGIPYVLDFRDLWDNRIMNKAYSPSFSEKVKNLVVHYWWEKWICQSKGIAITSEAWLQKMEVLFKKKGLVIENGFEEEILTICEQSIQNHFCIGFAGSLYPAQNIDIFIQGIKRFIQEEAPERFVVHFVGLNERNWPGIHEFIKSVIPDAYLKLTERVSKLKAVEILKSSQILFYPAFDSIEGWCSAKVYDYLAIGKNILVAPGDKGVVDEIIRKTGAGFVATDSFQAKEYIKKKYEEWCSSGFVSYNGNPNEIKKFSRGNQVKRMAEWINTSIQTEESKTFY